LMYISLQLVCRPAESLNFTKKPGAGIVSNG
jgi:hypothetical protein